LQVPRSQLLDYARAHGLAWQEDPGNQDTHHDRNFLRQRVMPLLRERWPQADLALLRSALLSADAVELLAQEDLAAMEQVQAGDAHCLSASALLELPAPRRARVLRRWIETLGLPPLPREGVAHLESDLLQARADASAKFRWGEIEIQRWRDLLHVQGLREPLPIDWQARWDGRQPLLLPDGGELVLDGADRFPAPLRVHARRGGERIQLPGRQHSHVLKHVLQDLGIPPWVRTQLPLLSDADGKLQALADLACSAHLDAWLRSKGARLQWRRGDQYP
jgi:tRNA(Ile)-lysidine synthetase, C-terminal domain